MKIKTQPLPLRKRLFKEEFRYFDNIFTALKLYALIEEVAEFCVNTVEE